MALHKRPFVGKKTTYDGTEFKSTYEAKIAEQYDLNKIKWTYEERRLPYLPAIAYYKIDWEIKWPWPNDSTTIIESKGYFSPEDQAKMKQIVKQYPGLDIRMMFQNPNLKIKPGNKITYTDWCEKNNIKCTTIEELIDEWNKRSKEKEKKSSKIKIDK